MGKGNEQKRVRRKGKRNKQQQAICICGANAMPMPTQHHQQHNPPIDGIKKGRRSM